MASQKSPWVDPTVSTLGETMSGVLFYVVHGQVPHAVLPI